MKNLIDVKIVCLLKDFLPMSILTKGKNLKAVPLKLLKQVNYYMER